jgi:hypothetical protein
LCATATSAPDGTYSVLNALEQQSTNCSYVNGDPGAVDEYRLEFEIPPSMSYLSPSFSGAGAPTTAVQSNTLVRSRLAGFVFCGNFQRIG